MQKQKNGEGEACIFTVLFDNEIIVLHDRENINNVKPLTSKDYEPRGLTALLDAIGGAVKHIGNIHKYGRKEDVSAKNNLKINRKFLRLIFCVFMGII